MDKETNSHRDIEEFIADASAGYRSTALALLSAEGTIISTNYAFQTLFGYDGDYLVGKPLESLTGNTFAWSDLSLKTTDNADITVPAQIIRGKASRLDILCSFLRIPRTSNYIAAFQQTKTIPRDKEEIRVVAGDIAGQVLQVVRAAVDAAVVAIGIADTRGLLRYVNRAYLDLWGYKEAEDVLGRPIDIFAHGDVRAKSDVATVFKALQEHGFWVGEHHALRHDGSRMDLLITASRVMDDSGRPIAFMASFLNVSAIKETSRRLEMFQYSIDHVSEAIYWIAADSSILYVNDAACRMLGYTREEMMAIKIISLDPQFPAERWPGHWQEVKKSGVMRFESEHRKKDGSILPIELTVNHLDFEGQEYIFAFVRDITDRLEAQKSLRDLARFPEENPSPVLRLNGDGIVIYANKAAGPVLGEFGCGQGQSLPEPFRSLVQEALTSQIPRSVKFPAGGFVYQLTFAPVSEGDYLNVYGQDITAILKATDELSYKEARYRALFENMGNGVAVYEVIDDGADIVFRDFNHAAEEIDDVSRKLIIGKSLFVCYPSVKETGLPDAIRRVWRTGRSESLPVFAYHDQRISGWRENSLYRLPTGEVVVVFKDITAQKMAEEALKISEEKYRELSQFRERVIDNADILIGVVDPEMKVLIWNKAAERVTGYSSADLSGQENIWSVLIPDDEERKQLITDIKGEVISGGLAEREGLAIRSRNGEDRYIAVSIRPLFDANGRLSAFLAIGRDITLQRLLEMQKRHALIQVNRNLEQLAILNDHIRNPLQVIVSLAAIEESENCTEIIRQAEEIDRLVKLLDKGWLDSLKVASFLRKHYTIDPD